MLLVDNVLISDLVIESDFECDLNACKGCCCLIGDRGSPVNREEVEAISKVKDLVLPTLTIENRQIIEESNFFIKDGEHMELQCGTNGSCVFSTKEQGKPVVCMLEKLWFEKKSEFRKPIFCHLFPLIVETFYDRQCINMEIRPECIDAINCGAPVVESCKDALLRLFSEEWYEKMVKQVMAERKRLGIE